MIAALDTNILAYAAGVDDETRRDQAIRLMQSIPSVRLLVPVQVLGELHAVLVRTGTSRVAAGEIVSGWCDFFGLIPMTAMVLAKAIELAADHGLTTWDAVILSAASAAGCNVLLSEDMHDGFIWGGVTVVNPFATTPHRLLEDLRRGVR